MVMKKFLAGCMAMLMLSMTGCASKEETTKKNTTTGTKERTESTSATEETTEPEETSDTQSSGSESQDTDPTKKPDATSDPGTTVSVVTSGADNAEGTLKIFIDGEEKEIPLSGYTSSTDPIFILDGYYEESGGTTDAMQNAREKYLKIITDEWPMNITKDLDLPDEIEGIAVTWSSSDESVIDSTGKVTRPFERSQYVILTATFTEQGRTMTLREVFRVARNMYDSIGVTDLLSLDDGYIWPENIGEQYEELKGSEGAWYIFEYFDDIVFFDPYPDDMLIYDNSEGPWIGYLLDGQFSDPRVDTAGEAYLCIASLRNILGFAGQFDQLKLDVVYDTMGDVTYDFMQCYQGVPVQGAFVRVISSYWRPFTTINLNLLKIPKGFSTTPGVTADQVMADHDLSNADLIILERDGEVKLVYHGYRSRASESVYVDALTGEEIGSYSTVIS